MSNSLLQYFRGLCFLDRLCLSFAPMVKRTGVISGFGGMQLKIQTNLKSTDVSRN
jgi:hypothetical protein